MEQPQKQRHREIQELARSYWEAEDRPEGRALEHWLRAEAAIEAPGSSDAQNGAGPE